MSNPLGTTEEAREIMYRLAGLDLPELDRVEQALCDRAAGLLGEDDDDLLRSYGPPDTVLFAFKTLTGRTPGEKGRSRPGRKRKRR